MKYLKFIVGLLGLALFITGEVLNLISYFRLKKQGVENVFKYVKANPEKVQYVKKWHYISAGTGALLLYASSFIND